MDRKEQQIIVNDLLLNAVYARVPKVTVGLEEDVSPNEGFDRHLSLWYDQEDHSRAVKQKRAMELYIEFSHPFRFSSSCSRLMKPFRDETVYESIERARERFGEQDIPPEIAPQIADAFDPDEWVVHCRYDINTDPEKFEQMHLTRIGTTIEITPQTFTRYHAYLQNVRSQITQYWGNIVSETQIEEFVSQHPEVWFNSWVDFFVDDGRDIYINGEGKQAPQVLEIEADEDELAAKGYIKSTPVEKSCRVAESLYENSLLIREIERIHKGEHLEFLLDSEVKKKAL